MSLAIAVPIPAAHAVTCVCDCAPVVPVRPAIFPCSSLSSVVSLPLPGALQRLLSSQTRLSL
eukprot:11602937-Alexandrium_andersonii.AAC.1